MIRRIGFSVVLGAFTALLMASGCVSTQEMAQTSGSIRTDAQYVEAVERAARRRGLVLQWVNPPLVERDDR